jgi:hypothetical protein
MKTAVQELIEYIQNNATKFSSMNTYNILQVIEPYLEKEKEQMIDFYNWMRRNDSSEEYFHYSDEDMLEQYLTKINNL